MIQNQTLYLEQVKGNTWCVRSPFIRIPFYKLDSNNIIMIDSGYHDPGDSGFISLLKENNLNVKAVITSHVHPDHTGNHRQLQEIFGATIYMNLFDAAVSSNPVAMKSHSNGDSLEELKERNKNMFCTADEIFSARDETLTVEGAEFKIIPLPGHATEHIGFITPDDVAYLADTLVSESVLQQVRMTTTRSCRLDLQSKKRAGELDCSLYILAHNEIRDEIASLAKINISAQLKRVDVIADLLDHYMSMEEVIVAGGKALGTHGDTIHKVFLIEANIRSYIECLLDSGRIVNRAHGGRIEYIRSELVV